MFLNRLLLDLTVIDLMSIVNSAGKRDRICVLFSSDKLLVTNRPKAAAEGSGLRPLGVVHK